MQMPKLTPQIIRQSTRAVCAPPIKTETFQTVNVISTETGTRSATETGTAIATGMVTATETEAGIATASTAEFRSSK